MYHDRFIIPKGGPVSAPSAPKEMTVLVTDLTQGKPIKRILGFCLPLMAGQLFQQFYNMVDSIIVGRFAGTLELSAVGSTGSLTFLVVGFVIGLCTGFSIPVSHAFGEQNMQKMRRFFINSVYLTVGVAAILTTVTLLLTNQVLTVMNTPDEIFGLAHDYIYTIFAGLTATLFYNLFAAVMRALGDSRTPLYLLIFSSILNIGLDLFFVIRLGMAVKGVAIATVIAQAASAVLGLVMILKKFPLLRLHREDFAPSLKMCGTLLYNGIPMALQVSVTAVGSIILQSAVNQLGADVIAGMAVATKIQLMLVLPSETIGITMATYCGQNLGARRLDRIKDGMRKSILIGMVYCVISITVARTLGRTLALLFVTGDQTAVIDCVQQFLNACSWFYPTLAVLFIVRNAIQGLGYSIPAMLAGFFELMARAVMGLVVIPVYGYTAVCYTNPMAWIAADCLVIPVYFIVFRLIKKRMNKGE